MIIRKAKKKDLKEIVGLFKQGFAEEPYYEKWTDKNATKKISEYFNSSKIKVVISRNIIGFIIYHEMIWDDHLKLFIDEMVVDKTERGKGIGNLLMNEVEKEALNNGAKGIELVSHIDSDAFKIYKNKGYAETGLVGMEKKI